MSLKSAQDWTTNNAVMGAFKDLGYTQGTTQPSDPFTWLGLQDVDTIGKQQEGQAWRKFINVFASPEANIATTDVASGDEVLSGNDISLDLKHDGLYMIVDKSGNYTVTKGDCTVTYRQVSPILMGTKLDGNITNAEGTVTVTLGKTGNVDVKQTQTTDCKTTGQFTKTDDKGNPLAGVTFQIYEWSKDTDPQETDFSKENLDTLTKYGNLITTGDDGVVKLENLVPGKNYLVVETSAPTGYLADYYAKLYVTVSGVADETGDKTVTIKPIGANSTQLWNDTDKKYMNITNTTELPKTGAAGVALFVAVAVLLLGSAGAVYVKSRRTKAMLR